MGANGTGWPRNSWHGMSRSGIWCRDPGMSTKEHVGGGPTANQMTHEGPFVGRDVELAEIHAALDDARSAHGRLLLLSGEPGIGKSRLIDEFGARVRAGGVQILWGRCWEAGGAPPYWPWVQLLRSYFRGHGSDAALARMGRGAADMAQILPEIRELLPDLQAPPTVDPDSARFQLFDSTASFFLIAAESEPIVLVLEDLHAADTPSLLFLRFLAELVGGGPLLILGTFRDVELTPDHPLTTSLAELSREPSTRRIHLRGLAENDVALFVEAASGVPPPPPLVYALHRETKGNPLFLGEAVRLLAVEGRLGNLADPAALRVAVPRGVRDVIVRRLGHLDGACRNALSLASVLGTEFATEALQGLSAIGSDELLDVLDRAVEAGLLAEVPGSLGRVRFSHDLVRETLYREHSSANRMRLHRRAAEALLETYAADEAPHLAELAHHLYEAAPLGDAATAVHYARRAGEDAARSLAYEEATRLYGMAVQALELDPPVDQGLHGELLLALGDSQARAGDLPAARETFLRAAANARRTGAASQLARAALGYGGRFAWARAGNDPHLIPMLQDALVLLGGGDDRLRVRLLTRLACALRSSPDRGPSDTLSRQAVELARRLDDPETMGYALVGRCWATYWPENTQERLELAAEILRAGKDDNDAERIFDAQLARCVFLADIGAVAEAWAVLEAMARMAEELRQPAQLWPVRAMKTLFALMEGDFLRAEELMASETPRGTALAIRDDASSHQMHRFLLLREQGRSSELEGDTRAAVYEFPWYPLHRGALACLLLDLVRIGEARAVFEDLATDGFRALYRDEEWLLGMALTSEACARLSDSGAAAVLYEQLLPFAGLHAVGHAEGSQGAIDRYLGLLSATMGRLDDAERHLQDAIDMNERMGAKPWTAHCRSDLADVLLSRDGPGDRERAIAELRSTQNLCQGLGMSALEASTVQRLAAFGLDVVPPLEPSAVVGPTVLRREGDYWTVAFEADAFRLKDAKGLHYLARLLAEPGREFHVFDLITAGQLDTKPGRPDRGGSRTSGDALGNAGAVLDPKAKAAYRKRLVELEDAIEDAESIGDADGAERARSERESIARELAAAVGLRGRDRMAASASERARVNVTRAVRATLSRIATHSPALGRHLDATVRTGTFCSYQPDPRVPVTWQS
jgi:tetratricopeptide (TPR) repeat protein